MRDMNGVDVCKALRSEAYNSDGRLLPIVAYTANSMAEDRINYIKAGFDEVLVKPIMEEELLQILENYLA